MTVRLPDELAARGQRYAAELGISLNGLLAVALREYLDERPAELRAVLPERAGSPPMALARSIAGAVKAGPRRRR